MKKSRKMFAAVSSSAVVLSSMLLGNVAFAQTTQTQSPTENGHGRGWGEMRRVPGVAGKVTSLNGSSITITSMRGPNGSGTTYTIDASNATVEKNGVASSLSQIAVGDMVMAEGTVNGTTVAATKIHDGLPQGMGRKGKMGGHGGPLANSIIQGNGMPVVGGNVTSVSGMTLSITNKSGVSYTIDATNATVEKAGASSTVSAIVSGDNVIVQGTVNGTNVTASSIIDSGPTPTPQTTLNGTSNDASNRPQGGFFGSIGGFFHRLFGFF